MTFGPPWPAVAAFVWPAVAVLTWPAIAVVVAAVLDAAAGEPPTRFHPVAWFGRLVALVDRDWGRPRLLGLVVAIGFPLLAAGAVAVLVAAGAAIATPVGAALAGATLFVASSLRLLVAAAGTVVRRSEGALARAREELPALVGRDPSALSAPLVRSAAVESAAENLADGLVAPLAYFVGGALAAAPFGTGPALAVGAGAAAWVKAVNTLDSMLGYRSKPVGWAPARLDDLAMWVPARLAGAAIALASGRPAALARARSLQSAVGSPNAGWPMGTAAAAHDVRLEKPGVYVLDGGDDPPTVADAEAAIRTVRRAGIAAYGCAALALAAPGVVG